MKSNSAVENNIEVSKLEFCACFHLDIDYFEKPLTKEIKEKSGFKKRDLRTILMKYQMDEYTDFLYQYIIIMHFYDIKELLKDIDGGFERLLLHKKQLNKLMKYFLDPNIPTFSAIDFIHILGKQPIKRDYFGDGVIDAMVDGAINALKEYYKRNRDERFEQVGKEETNNVSLQNVNIALSNINNAIENMHKDNNRRGRKFENYLSAQIGHYLSFLIRIDSLVSNDKGIVDIEDIKLTKEHCHFVYDCLRYCDLIKDMSDLGYDYSIEKNIRRILELKKLDSMERHRNKSGANLFFPYSIKQTMNRINEIRQKIINLPTSTPTNPPAL